jgi:hypothetical protein
MLATELPESLRRNLLWERQVSKVNIAGVRRSHSGGADLGRMRGMTSAATGPPGRISEASSAIGMGMEQGRGERVVPPNMVQLLPKGTLAQKEKEKEPQREGGGEEEKRKKAMARNKSWADTYHGSGW